MITLESGFFTIKRCATKLCQEFSKLRHSNLLAKKYTFGDYENRQSAVCCATKFCVVDTQISSRLQCVHLEKTSLSECFFNADVDLL